MGDGCVATLSTNFTTAQINLLVKACDEVFIMFDSEAKDRNAPKQALSLANQLTGLVKNVEILSLKDGDPADLTDEEALRIRKEINL
jgi:DNA primase